jgi:hypothetical protein
VATTSFGVFIVGGQANGLQAALRNALTQRTQPYMGSGETLLFPDIGPGTTPDGLDRTAMIVFGDGPSLGPTEAPVVELCLGRGVPVFPVVSDLKRFSQLAPTILSAYNGFQLATADHIEELAGLVLEVLGLQRSRRKIFISYVRAESEPIAQQLHDAFLTRWYTVFLDSLSIRPGKSFQEELMSELADSDVFLLLNSPSAASRPYVKEEITFADQAAIGGVQVTWPGVAANPRAGLFMPLELTPALANFPASGTSATSLTRDGIDTILATVAATRTANQQQREKEFEGSVKDAVPAMWNPSLRMGRSIVLEHTRIGLRQVWLDLTLGVPTSRDMQRAVDLQASWDGKARMIYDRHGITNSQADHIAFLQRRLNLELLAVDQAAQWLPGIPG